MRLKRLNEASHSVNERIPDLRPTGFPRREPSQALGEANSTRPPIIQGLPVEFAAKRRLHFDLLREQTVEYSRIHSCIARIDIEFRSGFIIHPHDIVEAEPRSPRCSTNPRLFPCRPLRVRKHTERFCALQQPFPELQSQDMSFCQLLLLRSKRFALGTGSRDYRKQWRWCRVTDPIGR